VLTPETTLRLSDNTIASFCTHVPPERTRREVASTIEAPTRFFGVAETHAPDTRL
jgi:hypothetical protein